MNKALGVMVILLLAVSALYAIEPMSGLRLDVSLGYGISSASYYSMVAEDFGDAYFSDPALFSDESFATLDLLKRGKVGLDFWFTDSFAMGIGAAYANRPFRHTFAKATAPTDYVFVAYYEMLEYSVALKSILWKHMYLGGGISSNVLLNKAAYELYDNGVILSYLDLAENTSSAYLDLGLVFGNGGNAVFIFAKYNGDLDEIFPYEWDVSHVALIDLSLNLGLSVPIF